MSENKSFDELLLPVRNDIDRIDKELLKLFTERMHCAERVAEIKRKAGIPVLNAAREQVILDRVKKEAGEYGDSAVALYSAIMSISRARQHNMLKSGGVLRDLEQNSPKTLKADPRVICQGAAGAFSNRPQDTQNHLMDALRYAMEDLPRRRTARAGKTKDNGSLVRAGDLRGSWGG